MVGAGNIDVSLPKAVTCGLLPEIFSIGIAEAQTPLELDVKSLLAVTDEAVTILDTSDLSIIGQIMSADVTATLKETEL